jgi:hypothetical protein
MEDLLRAPKLSLKFPQAFFAPAPTAALRLLKRHDGAALLRDERS